MKNITQKMIVAISAALIMSVSLAASAVTVSPAGMITASGPTTLDDGNGLVVPCTTTMTGNVSTGGNVTIASASFSGSDPRCSFVQAANLPWTGQFASNAASLTLNAVEVDVPLLSVMCGPASVTPSYANSTVTFNSTSLGACSIDGSLNITPTQTVTP